MRKEHTFKVPSKLILDCTLSYSARLLGAVLYSRTNAQGVCRKSFAELAELSGCCVETVRLAMELLENGAYIKKYTYRRYDEGKCRIVCAKNAYHCILPVDRDFTLIPRSVFRHKIRNSSFVLYFYLRYRAGNSNRAFPSLGCIAKDLGMARSTVCECNHELDEVNLIYIQPCIKENRSNSTNSYFLLCQAIGVATRYSAPHAIRSCVGHSAIKRLYVLLAGRYRLGKVNLAIFPYIQFRPLQQRWKPPFLWGGLKISKCC